MTIIALLNVRSVAAKLPDIACDVLKCASIMWFCETWLTPSWPSPVLQNHQIAIRCDSVRWQQRWTNQSNPLSRTSFSPLRELIISQFFNGMALPPPSKGLSTSSGALYWSQQIVVLSPHLYSPHQSNRYCVLLSHKTPIDHADTSAAKFTPLKSLAIALNCQQNHPDLIHYTIVAHSFIPYRITINYFNINKNKIRYLTVQQIIIYHNLIQCMKKKFDFETSTIFWQRLSIALYINVMGICGC